MPYSPRSRVTRAPDGMPTPWGLIGSSNTGDRRARKLYAASWRACCALETYGKSIVSVRRRLPSCVSSVVSTTGAAGTKSQPSASDRKRGIIRETRAFRSVEGRSIGSPARSLSRIVYALAADAKKSTEALPSLIANSAPPACKTARRTSAGVSAVTCQTPPTVQLLATQTARQAAILAWSMSAAAKPTPRRVPFGDWMPRRIV